jgi:hypothetical protein
MAEWRRAFRHPFQALDEAIVRAETCRGCGCKPGQWREDCDCTRDDCECGGFRGPDTDFDDTFDYVPPTGPAEPARGKWWLKGKCSYACADVNCPPYGPCQREERFEADRLPPASFTWLDGPPPAVPTDEQVDAMGTAVDEAFAERDRLWGKSDATGSPEDAQALLDQDAHASALLDRYAAACAAQRAESDQRRDVNVARHERDQNAARGDLASALQGDDWLEDHGMHGDERRTCHQCQSWADHAHDQITNRRITREQWEGRSVAPEGWDYAPGGSDDDTGRGPVDMPPAAEPYQPPAKTEASLADVAREWLSELQFNDIDPEDLDDHDLIPDEDVLRAADRIYDGGLRALARDLWEVDQPSAPRDVASQPTEQGAAMSTTQHEDIFDEIGRLYDAFFKRLFRDWGKSSEEVLKLQHPVKRISRQQAKDIAANVSAKLAGKKAAKVSPAPPEPATPEQPDTRPRPEPQDLDALAAPPPPPPAGINRQFAPPPPPPQIEFEQDWCTCTGLAHDAHCRAAAPELKIGDLRPPPSARSGNKDGLMNVPLPAPPGA